MPIQLPHDRHVSAGAHKSGVRQDCATPTHESVLHTSALTSADDGDAQFLTHSACPILNTREHPPAAIAIAATPMEECETVYVLLAI